MPDPSYSPRLRTGVVLCGCGTAGGYQAGALRALLEAGIKIDVVAAHGAGAINACCAAIDAAPRLWAADGPWTSPRLRQAYRWRRALRAAGWGLAAACGLLLLPLLVLVLAVGAYALSVIAALLNLTTTSEFLVGAWAATVAWLFSPPVLPTLMPRAVLLAVVVVAAVLAGAALGAVRRERSRRRVTGAFWWRLLGAPLDGREPGETGIETVWTLVRGASSQPRPDAAELGRRFVDLLAENFGQPGFRELLVAVHDLDARRDLVAAVIPAERRAAFAARRPGAGPREAETIDLTGDLRPLLVDVLAGALRLPVATEPATIAFPSDGYWRGETHRLCDRPEIAVRLVQELAGLGVEQVILISPAALPAVPHGMRSRAIDLRGRVGEFVRSIETAVLDDAVSAAAERASGVFVVRPDHNPVPPFAFDGVYDEASDRQRTMDELLEQGYRDAYRQFIDPVVATGERMTAAGEEIA